MDRKLLYKLLSIGLLTLLLMLPLFMIEDQIRGRSLRQDEVKENIARSAAGAQTLVGPVLAIRYRERGAPETRKDPDTGQITTSRPIHEHLLTLPAKALDIRGKATVERRSRGIYQARLFHLDLSFAGNFQVPGHLGLSSQVELVDAQAVLLLGLADPRGVSNDPEVSINGQIRRFEAAQDGLLEQSLPGKRLELDLGPLPLDEARRFDFSFPLKLTGTEELAIAPSAEANTIELTSDWPHPSFQGRFLPRERQVDGQGFAARWEVSHLARSLEATLLANDARFANDSRREVLGISFMDPVNVYLQAERAVKYGSLFIVLTFAAFFLGELLRRRPVHPMQYLLVGLALAMFFLLLIALSEHFTFLLAYLISAAACIGLICTYLAGVLGGRRPALAFGAGFTGLYGVLYGVLQSEDNSLLMGSLLLFIALGAIMLSTRRLNWYRLGEPGHGEGEA